LPQENQPFANPPQILRLPLLEQVQTQEQQINWGHPIAEMLSRDWD
jgi:hypothetical protein